MRAPSPQSIFDQQRFFGSYSARQLQLAAQMLGALLRDDVLLPHMALVGPCEPRGAFPPS